MPRTVYCIQCGLVEPPHRQHLAEYNSLPDNPEPAPPPRKALDMWKILPSKLLLLPIVRHLATSFGGFLAGSGIATSQEAAAIAGGLIALISVVWGIFEKRNDVERIEANGN